MHSTLRRELCGTPKIIQSVRTRSRSRPSTNTRKFSSRPPLPKQSGPKDSTANCSNSNPNSESSDGSSNQSPNLGTPAQGLSAELEKWIQVYSDKGQSLHVWDTISEKDENGKRRLLPHVKKDLERAAARTTRDGTLQSTRTETARVRPLASSDVRHGKESGVSNTENAERDPLPTEAADETIATQNALQQSAPAGEATEVVEHDSGINGPPQTFDGNPVSKFHGSSAARRQRERKPKPRDKTRPIILPEWFQERNVSLWGEDELRYSVPAQVEPIWDNSETPTKLVVSMSQPGPRDPGVSQVVRDPVEDDVAENPPAEKEQTFASDPDGDNAGDNGIDASGSEGAAADASSLVALPNSEKRYYIHGAQRTELTLTARGRLRLPAAGSSHNRPAGIRSHVLVHYTANDGDIFLDRLIEDVARQLRCNLITLDAQDISALASKADIEPMVVDEVKTMSYEIYSDVYKEESPEETPPRMFPDDMEDGDEDGPPGPHGIPFAIGKPITIDLKAIFGSKPQRSNSPSSLKNTLGEVMGWPSLGRPDHLLFQPIVDSILSSPNNKRKLADGQALQQAREESLKDTTLSHILPKDATIIHVKDLKAIQDTNVGKHFLAQLFEQVERRRNSGEGIMLIGTSCERGETPYYDTELIRTSQVSEPEEMSSTIFITPAYPRTGSETDSESGLRDEVQRSVIPKQDRAKRIQIINARHLYEMLQSKGVSLNSLKEGFWTTDLADRLDEADQECLAKSFWSFSHIQRLAAILASSDFTKSSHPIAQAAGILDHSDKLKFKWAKQTQPERSKQGKKDKDSDEPENEKLAQIRSKATKHEKRLLSGVVEPRKIATTFRDIHIPLETVDALQTLTTLSLVRPDAFKYGVLASDRIPGLLLYGPPGTGKTLAAKAVARESGATMLEVSAADINDMYVGEGEKNVKALFSLAKKLSPCVVFLDEADAMFSARSNAGRRVSHRELLNQFLKEWDGMSNDSGSAFIMVATNRPMDLDDAVLRRLPRRLLIDLPAEKDRLEILKIHLRQEHLADDVDLAKLAAKTQFYSGSDLKNVAVAAALNCVREENELAKQHTGNDPYTYPEKRTLTPVHFEKALEEISASISEDMASLRDIKKFDEQYGDKKGRKKRRSPKWGFKTAAEADSILDTVKVRS